MPTGRWRQRILAMAAGGAATLLVSLGAPTIARADEAALAAWLTKAFDPIQQVHVAENELIPILAPMMANPDDDAEDPLDDVNALKAPCDRLAAANAALAGMVTTPDADLSAEIQQAVDSIDTSVQNCAKTIDDNDINREKARVGIQGSLSDAEAHLASADIILAKLNKAK